MSTQTLGIVHMDPQETRWFTMDWSRHLADTESIIGSTWSVPLGLSVVLTGVDVGLQKTTVMLTGGVADTDYVCTNSILTGTSGETLQRSGTVRVRDL